jgi:Zn-dependent protease
VHVASPFGIPFRLHWSFSGLVLWIVGQMVWFLGFHPGLMVGAILVVGLTLSVGLHELGHALAARRYGIGTRDITLYPFGGVASIERMPEDPDQELVIALAGPAVNFVLAAIGGWLWLGTGWEMSRVFVATNLVMGVFNLIPAFPMDGGRVLRALLAKWMGFIPASRLSVRIGRVFAWGFLIGGVYWSNLGLLMVGAFLHVALNSEKARLIDLHWQRTTGQQPWWTDSDKTEAPPSAWIVTR